MKWVIQMPGKEEKIIEGSEVLIKRVEDAGGTIRPYKENEENVKRG